MTPTQIGRYAIKGELGRGGMAAVYRAYDPRFKREVAVKILPREFMHEPTFRARFEREAQTIAALEHSAIVPVYDYGEEAEQPYLVMRLMPGGSLSDRLAQGPLALREAAHILGRLASALDRAHGLGIVHRDLKPGNILFDAEGLPYISDFGLAKLTRSDTQLTQTGVMGTPAYMSPEQVRGDKVIDGRADIYALGAILYHMLTGQWPYEADTPMGMAFKHVSEPPPRLREVRPDLPAACEAVIARAMAKDPAERFASATQLVAALEAALGPDVAVRTRPADQNRTLAVPPPGPSDAAPAGPVPAAPRPVVAGRPAARWLLPLLLGGFGLVALAGVGGLAFVATSLLAARDTGTPTLPALAQLTESEQVVGVPSSTAAPSATREPAPATAVVPTSGPTTAPSPSLAATASPAASATLAAGATRVAAVDGMVQAYVPAGEFAMGNDQGAPDQRPMHTVYLDAFWIDRTEVTNAMYARCVAVGVCAAPLEARSITRPSYYGNEAFAGHPVLFVNWPQARTYCEWAGRRLPTEAEWEKAARGVDERLYPWGNEPPAGTRLNYGLSGFGDTVVVGQYPGGASPYGALDMAGNAWEWVADWYDPAYYSVSPSVNPAGPAQTGCPNGDCKVLRGGSWDSRNDQATTTVRLFYGPNDSRDAFTVRCAQSAE